MQPIYFTHSDAERAVGTTRGLTVGNVSIESAGVYTQGGRCKGGANVNVDDACVKNADRTPPFAKTTPAQALYWNSMISPLRADAARGPPDAAAARLMDARSP